MPDASVRPSFSTAQFRNFIWAAVVLTIVFAVPLWRLFTNAIHDDLFSYIPLMPFVALYLASTLKPELPSHSSPARGLAIFFFVISVAAMAGYFALVRAATPETVWNSLALSTLAWVLCIAGAGCWFLGAATMRSLVYPFCLLLFMIPFPVFVRDYLEMALQNGSAVVADWMFALVGTPVFRAGTLFRLPDMSFHVAPECSGIHSTWILFITSLVAGRIILSRPWKRAVLCLVIIPLALLRNAFRICVIGELCVHIGPQMIDSPIHHRGGPIFFILSLVPFFLLLYFLRKTERTGVVEKSSESEK